MRIDKNTTIRLGNRNIVKVKLGDSVIWQKTTEPVEGPDYFYIESLGDGNTVSVKNVGNGSTTKVTPTLEYSTDKNTWNTITFDWTNGTHTTELPVTLNTGEKMYFRNDTRKFSNYYNKYISFSSSVSSNVGGDIRTLSNYLDVNSETKSQSYMFYNLFYNNQYIVDASNLRLPYTTLADICYNGMFYGCSKLTTAPTLPSTTLASYCYQSMFYDCTSLTTTPELPATTLAERCYQSMFRGCTSLTTTPELPATTLADSCYYEMFRGCTSLTTAPELPATTLVSGCYSQMFRGCSKLTTTPELPATTLSDYCYYGMFYDCKSLTSAPTLPSTTLASDCYRNMFYGCTILTTAPTLPSTTLASYCYQSMFYGCTSLTTTPELPATTLVSGCYQNMFSGCSSLNSITVYADDISATNCTINWLSGVASSGTFNNYGSATYTVNSPSGIPTGWTEVKPTWSWNVVTDGTYPFELNSNGYYESTNKGQSSSYSYATLNYSGFNELVLECINSGEPSWDYGIISQPDVELSKSDENDGLGNSTNVFYNFNVEQSTNPVQLTIPSDGGSHFITIKYKKDGGVDSGNDSFQFKVIEP